MSTMNTDPKEVFYRQFQITAGGKRFHLPNPIPLS